MKERNVDSIVEMLRHVRDHGRGCSLLLGAGCSVTAGIPLALEFVAYVKKEYPEAYGRAGEKTYPKVMDELAPTIRRDLIAKEVDGARMNWAHIAIAQLVKEGYVDRVLTTNFDLLVSRACALVGEFPAVYDFAASQTFQPANVPDKAIFHLHGQRTGFVLMITEDHVAKHAKLLGPLFDDARRGRTWIVVGYSGENDGVFDNLAAEQSFDLDLYWIGFRDQDPAIHVKTGLLEPDKNAYLIRGYDADRFFIDLSQKLGCFPPTFVDRPFTHVAQILETLTDFPIAGGDQQQDFLTTTKQTVSQAIDRFEEKVEAVQAGDAEQIWKTPREALDMAANALLMAGKYDELQEIGRTLEEPASSALAEALAWSHNMQGTALLAQAGTKSGAEADGLYAAAREKYAEALTIKPGFHEALNNWGTALLAQAKTKSGAEVDGLYLAAREKYAEALTIKPDFHEALTNWGAALSGQAEIKSGAEADSLYAAAGEKYAEALTIKPDFHKAHYNWGTTLLAQAKTKSGAEADGLYAAAGEKHAEALTIKPNHYEALYNWGNTLSSQAKTKSGAEADRLFTAAGEKYAQALTIKPNHYEALYNWGNTLLAQAKTKSGASADGLYAAAREKYAEAVTSKPDKHWALNNWGNALLAQATTKTGAAADGLYVAAREKYAEALTIKPDFHEALNNWGAALCVQAKTRSGAEADGLFGKATEKLLRAEKLHSGSGAYNLALIAALRGNPKECRRWLEQALMAGTLPNRQHLETHSNLDSVRNEDWFKVFLGKV